jgi:hypothetical protein
LPRLHSATKAAACSPDPRTSGSTRPSRAPRASSRETRSTHPAPSFTRNATAHRGGGGRARTRAAASTTDAGHARALDFGRGRAPPATEVTVPTKKRSCHDSWVPTAEEADGQEDLISEELLLDPNSPGGNSFSPGSGNCCPRRWREKPADAARKIPLRAGRRLQALDSAFHKVRPGRRSHPPHCRPGTADAAGTDAAPLERPNRRPNRDARQPVPFPPKRRPVNDVFKSETLTEIVIGSSRCAPALSGGLWPAPPRMRLGALHSSGTRPRTGGPRSCVRSTRWSRPSLQAASRLAGGASRGRWAGTRRQMRNANRR